MSWLLDTGKDRTEAWPQETAPHCLAKPRGYHTASLPTSPCSPLRAQDTVPR